MLRVNEIGDALEIDCGSCGATNRVPVRRLGDRAVCGRCKDPLAVDSPVEVTDATFDKLIGESALPVLVDFWAPWCGPCRVVGPELEKVARQKQGDLLIAKLNSDENQRTSSRFGIKSIPTLLLFERGQEARRLLGAMPASEIISQLGLGPAGP